VHAHGGCQVVGGGERYSCGELRVHRRAANLNGSFFWGQITRTSDIDIDIVEE
jgi:hypothetical protein